jgi:dienelactone hydrolase
MLGMRRRFRILFVLLAPVSVLSIALALWYARRDHVAVIAARADRLVRVDTLGVAGPGGVTGDRVIELRLANRRGLAFTARVRRPPAPDRPLPAVLLLAGVETGADAVLLTPLGRDIVQMAIDYPWDGPQLFSRAELVAALPRLRESAFDAAAASLLAADFLASAPGVDRDSVFIVGCSFGAIFGPIAAAARPEVDALVIVQGGGDLRRLIEANLRYGGIERFPKVLSAAGAVLLHPFEPTRWIGRVSPSRVILVNGSGDVRIPRPCVDALLRAARDPKEMIWVDAGHLHPDNEELIRRLTEEVEAVLFAGPPVSAAAGEVPCAPGCRVR